MSSEEHIAEFAPIEVEERGTTRMGFPTGVTGSDFIKSGLDTFTGSAGWVVRDGDVQEWRIEGFTQRDGHVYFLGSHEQGISLDQSLRDEPAQGLARLKTLVGALMALQTQKVPHFRLQSDAVYFLPDDGMLFLPPRIMDRISILRPYQYKVLTFEVLNHPDLDAKKQYPFTIGVLAYRMLMGRFPFEGEDDIEVRNRIRNQRLVAPSLADPHIRPEVSDVIMRAIERGGPSGPTLEKWNTHLYTWLTEGYARELSGTQREEAANQAREREVSIRKGYQRILFFQRYRRIMAISGAVLLVVGFVLGSILSNVLAPRVTRGFTPYQVVETFYSKINEMDHTTMEDCVVEDAGKGEINECINLFVMTRMAVGYEGTSHIVAADQWDEAGRPELGPQNSIYGTVMREIKAERPEPQPVFLVTYEKWVPQPEDPDEEEEERNYYGYDRVDRVMMRLDKDDWVIYEIERVSNVKILPEDE